MKTTECFSLTRIIYRSNCNHKWQQLAGAAYIYPLHIGIAHTGPVVGVPPTADLANARPPRPKESHYIHLHPSELMR